MNIEHGGNIYTNKVKWDYSTTLNPFGLPDAIKNKLINSISDWDRYPDPSCNQLKALASARYGFNADSLVFFNGAAEFLYDIVKAINPKCALTVAPSFTEYTAALNTIECKTDIYFLNADNDFRLDCQAFCNHINDDTDIVFICNPNNPNGLLINRDDMAGIAKRCEEKHCYLIIDECLKDLSSEGLTDEVFYNNPYVILLRAFTKSHALAGIRLAYANINQPKLIDKLNRIRQPWSVSVPAQIAGAHALTDCDDYIVASREFIQTNKPILMTNLKKKGYKVYPSDGNYLLFYSDNHNLKEEYLKKEILIRDCSNYQGLGPGYYRVRVGKYLFDD